MPRESDRGTGFRKSQARAVLLAVIRMMAPRMVGRGSLRAVVRSLAEDPRLWAELDPAGSHLHVHGRASTPASSVMTAPIVSWPGEPR